MLRDTPLPNLIIAGVGKAGTTSLFSYLGQHREICPSDLKELNYFASSEGDGGHVSSLADYRQRFEHWDGERYLLEASPRYWFNADRVIPAMQETLDRPRVIIALREPAARLWSSYTYLKSRARIGAAMSCDEFITACEQFEGEPDDPTSGPVTPLMVGMYSTYLGKWLDAFGEDLRVIFADDLFTDPKQVVASLCDWLGLPADTVDSFSYGARNQTVNPRSRAVAKLVWAVRPFGTWVLRKQPGIRSGLLKAYARLNGRGQIEEFSPETRARLESFYRDSNEETTRFLASAGYSNLPSWLQSSSASV